MSDFDQCTTFFISIFMVIEKDPPASATSDQQYENAL